MARIFILPGALALLGVGYLLSLTAHAQDIDKSELSYYANVKPMMDYPLPDLVKAAPELQGMEPAANQDQLASILDKAGEVAEDLLAKMPNLISREDVTQTKLSDQGSLRGQRRHQFDYLIIVRDQDSTLSVEESRLEPGGTGEGTQHPEAGYTLTKGFATVWLHFLSPNQLGARFRYLGQQSSDGIRCYVVGFAQIPESAAISGIVIVKGKPVQVFDQGIAWIDESSFRIVRMRMDLLAPRPDIGVEKVTTELHFGETNIPQAASPLWLPKEVTVTARMNNHQFRNVHHYSEYRLFTVESKILPAPPEPPQPAKPN